MAYTINYSDSNKGIISIEDSTINQQTSLDIPGRNTTSYGSVIAENFLILRRLEIQFKDNYGMIAQLVLIHLNCTMAQFGVMLVDLKREVLHLT